MHGASSELPGEDAAAPVPRTVQDKLRWLMDTAHPAGRGPYSIQDVCLLIARTTGEKVSHTTIWKLVTGQQVNPSMRVIDVLARSFGVEPAFFFDDGVPREAVLDREGIELLAEIRDQGITIAGVRELLALGPEGRKAVTGAIARAAAAEARRIREEEAPGLTPGRVIPPAAAGPAAA